MHSEWHLDIEKISVPPLQKFLYNMANRELRYPWRVSHNTVDALETERAFCHNLIDEVRQRFVKMITDFSYNRRYHSFSYSSSRLDPHSDYWRFWSAGRNRFAFSPCLPQVLDSPPSQLAVGNCMHSDWHLYIWKLCFIFTRILYNVANREPRYPRRASHNTVDALEMERAFCHNPSDESRQRWL